MSIRLPQNNKWTQNNKSDLSGSIFYSKNMNLDEDGYFKLSPRMMAIESEEDNTNFSYPTAVGFSQYTFSNEQSLVQLGTADDHFTFTISNTGFSVTEDNHASAPDGSNNSSGVFWQNRWHVSESTVVTSKGANGDYTATWTDRITGLASATPHPLEVFKNKNELAVGDGNTVKLYNTSYSLQKTLTLPVGMTVTGLCYNNLKLGITTKLDSDSQGEKGGAYFFVWDGATTSANAGVSTGAIEGFTIFPFLGTFAIVLDTGQIRIWNGGGFTDNIVTSFPHYYQPSRFDGTILAGASVIDGGVAYINTSNRLTVPNKTKDLAFQNFPAGVYCLDTDYGLYHRFSPSISKMYLIDVLAAGVNTSTDVITANSGTIPETGSAIRYINDDDDPIGGLKYNEDYYIIKLTSSTFQLATTRENALNGIYIDLTAQSASTTYFHAYEQLDYCQTYYETAGAIGLFQKETYFNGEIITGGALYNESLTEYDQACITVPGLNNYGYIVLPKIIPAGKKDNTKSLVVNHRPLTGDDKITVKYKPTNDSAFPVVTPQIGIGGTGDRPKADWTSDNEFYTKADLGDVKTYLEKGADFEVECEIVAGAGAGQAVKVSSISTDDNITYAVVLEESVLGASSGRASYFIMDNWKVSTSVTTANQDGGVAKFPISNVNNATDIKIEMFGSDIAVRVVDIISENQEKMI